MQHIAMQCSSASKRNERNKVDEGLQRNTLQCSAAVQVREMREIK